MVFHVGAIWRLHEAGWLSKLDRISSVSGGSITAGVLATAWDAVGEGAGARARLEEHFVTPLRRLASKTIDASGVVRGLLLPGNVSQRIEASYRRQLFGVATLQDLPDRPRFVINATNVQSGVLCRFSKPYLRDYRVGEIKSPKISLAAAVAASSAFPPVLSPMVLEVDPSTFTPGSGSDLQREPFTRRLVLTDGGVYDNLGLETAWKRYKTVLVSDAGGQMLPEGTPKEGWARHSYRILNIIDNQVRSLRKRQLIDGLKSGARQGAYWGVRTNVGDYGLGDALPCPHERALDLAAIPTRLARLEPRIQEQLINWGYSVCDAALRRHVDRSLPRGRFPYPDAGV